MAMALPLLVGAQLEQSSRAALGLRLGLHGRARTAVGRAVWQRAPAPRRASQFATAAAAAAPAPADPGADPALVARVRAQLESGAVPPTIDAEEARVLYAEGGWALLDVRSEVEHESEGRVLPKMPWSLAAPLSAWSKRYDAAAGRKVVDKPPADGAAFVAAVRRLAPVGDDGLVLVCSGVPCAAAGGLRCEAAAALLRDAGYARLTCLSGGYASWSLKWTNKLERRVVGFVIASGGTSIEQRDGASSKGSGVAGKGVDDLMRDALASYNPGGVYA
jgi:hypothetical protein